MAKERTIAPLSDVELSDIKWSDRSKWLRTTIATLEHPSPGSDLHEFRGRPYLLLPEVERIMRAGKGRRHATLDEILPIAILDKRNAPEGREGFWISSENLTHGNYVESPAGKRTRVQRYGDWKRKQGVRLYIHPTKANVTIANVLYTYPPLRIQVTSDLMSAGTARLLFVNQESSSRTNP